jgi:hypothetical protein
MGWDAIVAGTLRFPSGKLADWLRTSGELVEAPWPAMIAMALAAETPEGNARQLVDAATRYAKSAMGAGPGLLDIVRGASDVTVRALLPEDDYRAIGGKLVGLACAAARCGASGRLLFCDAGTRKGEVLVLHAGRVRFGRVGGRMDSADDEAFRDVMTRSAQKTAVPKASAELMERTMAAIRRRIAKREQILAARKAAAKKKGASARKTRKTGAKAR